MKQILQNLSNGKTTLEDVPCPKINTGSVLIKTSKTLVSVGTERMLVDFGKANLLDKARQQPDKVKQVVDKVKSDGLLPTIDAVRSKLDQPIPLGYCNAGKVIESSIEGFSIGERVVSNGSHAEVVRVNQNLCAKIPDNVDDESAAFTVMGAIGLQGIRLLKPTLGECFVVTGLGMIGLLCVQMLRANGCRVLGIDIDTKKCEIAKSYGAETVNLSNKEDPLLISKNFSRGRGVDGVLIAASSDSDEVIHQSAQMCRKRGRIVLVGVIGLDIRRDDFYKKEITFQVSSSYGPGRYDPLYEDQGHDYPIAFVRWTEQRNFEAVLDMISSGKLDLKSLITHRYDIVDAIEAYSKLDESSTLGVILDYSKNSLEKIKSSKVILDNNNSDAYDSLIPRIGFIGAGNYASRILIPAFNQAEAVLDTVVTSSGISGLHHGNKNGFLVASTEIKDLWNGKINTVCIATRHNDHSSQVIEALKNGNNVFVEKPLALTNEEIDSIEKAYKSAKLANNIRLMVGFNRRFAPHIIKMKDLLNSHRSPKSIIMTINAGEISSDHWVHDSSIGGGRIIGEACHFIDLMRFLIGYPIVDYQAMMIGKAPGVIVREDKVSITLSFQDGSFGSIHYFANGGSEYPKEHIEVFCDNAVLKMNNYRLMEGHSWIGFKKMRLIKQDKGQNACVKEFLDAIRLGKQSPIPFNEIIESSRISIEIAESLRQS